MRRPRSISILLAAALLLGACDDPEPPIATFPVPTQPEPVGGVTACMDALASGTLVADARWGIALGQTNGPTLQVVWPAGYFGREVDGAIELLDASGGVVGRVGENVTIGGGMGAGEAWWACGSPDRAS